MEQFKVAGAVGSNAMLAAIQAVAQSPPLETILIVCQILVALVTVAYVGTKVWLQWRGKKKDK